jgi:hypothetical protein
MRPAWVVTMHPDNAPQVVETGEPTFKARRPGDLSGDGIADPELI